MEELSLRLAACFLGFWFILKGVNRFRTTTALRNFYIFKAALCCKCVKLVCWTLCKWLELINWSMMLMIQNDLYNLFWKRIFLSLMTVERKACNYLWLRLLKNDLHIIRQNRHCACLWGGLCLCCFFLLYHQIIIACNQLVSQWRCLTLKDQFALDTNL